MNPPAPDITFPREYRGVYLERRRACGFQLYEAVGVTRGDREGYAKQGFENYKLFGAPHVAIITSDEALGTYGVLDCGAYVSNFLRPRNASALHQFRRRRWPHIRNLSMSTSISETIA